MARQIANVSSTTETFQNWLDKTNQSLDLLSTTVLTVSPASATQNTLGMTPLYPNGSSYVGYGHVNGFISVDNLIAVTALRGGNTTSSSNLNITSNAVFTGAVISGTSNVNLTGANTTIASANTRLTGNVYVAGSLTQIVSNAEISGANTTVSSANTRLTGNVYIAGTNTQIVSNTTLIGSQLTVASNVNMTGANTTIASANTQLTGNVTIAGTTATITSNILATGISHTIAGNVAFDTNVLFVDSINNRVGILTTTPNAPLQVSGAANVSGVLTVGANIVSTATLSGLNAAITNNLTANVVTSNTANINVLTTNNVTFNVEAVLTGLSNTNLGTNTTAGQVIFTYPYATYRSSKILLTVTNGTSYQSSELMTINNSTDVNITNYATLNIGPTANLGIATAIANTTSGNIEIRFQQTTASSSARVIATLIRV